MDHWYVIEPSVCVTASLNQLGKATSTFGHWKHAVRILYGWLFPRCCVRKSIFQYYVDLAAKEKTIAEEAAKKAKETA